MTKKVIFTMGGKGGVGKTASMVNLAEYFDYHKIPRLLIDCDMENKKKGSLYHFYPESQKINIRKPDGLDIFIDATSEAESPVILADLGAGAGTDLIKWFKEMYFAAERLGISFLAVGCITSNPGSMETVFSWANELQDNVDYLIVRNTFQGDLELWNSSPVSKQFKRIFYPSEINAPARIPEWQTELENHGLTLTSAMKSKHPLFSKLSAQCRLEAWRNQIFKELDKCRNILVP